MRWFSHPPDRRRSKRFKADIRVVVTLIGTTDVIPLRTHCESVSEAGLSVSGLSSLAVGDRVTLELDIPVATARHLWVEAIVRRSGDPCALEFVSLNDKHRNLIKRYCRLQPEEKRRR
jgi:hypothetical protein